jgi:medium-chain acyl-[acyl-carrier-protein] hydrolase
MDRTDTGHLVWSREFAAWTNGRVIPHRRDDRVRLLCFPPAGSGATAFGSWSADLAPYADLWPIQLPGREGRWREPPPSGMILLAATLSEVLSPLFEEPYAFVGHSMGGFIAFELARALRRRRAEPPVCLLVCATRAPHLPDPNPPPDRSDARLLGQLRDLHGVPRQVQNDPDLLRVFVPTIRADLAMCWSYTCRPEAPLDCPIAAYGGADDRTVPVEYLRAWARHTTARFSMQLYEGHHFFVVEQRTALLRAIAAELLGATHRAAV